MLLMCYLATKFLPFFRIIFSTGIYILVFLSFLLLHIIIIIYYISARQRPPTYSPICPKKHSETWLGSATTVLYSPDVIQMGFFILFQMLCVAFRRIHFFHFWKWTRVHSKDLRVILNNTFICFLHFSRMYIDVLTFIIHRVLQENVSLF